MQDFTKARRIATRPMTLVGISHVLLIHLLTCSHLEDERSIANKLAREEKVSESRPPRNRSASYLLRATFSGMNNADTPFSVRRSLMRKVRKQSC